MSLETTEQPRTTSLNVLTHSSVSCWQQCPRKFYFRYELGLRPKHAGNALRRGSAFHVGIDPFKRGLSEEAAVRAVLDFYRDTQRPPWLSPEDYQVEQATSYAMVRAYCRHYADDKIVEYIAVEKSFELPIVNPETGRPTPAFNSAGKIDAIVRLPDARLAVQEEKTVGTAIDPAADYWKRLQLDAQISRYVLAARSLGYDIATVVYYATRKPLIKPKDIAKRDRARATSQGRYFDHVLTAECPQRETPELYGARVLHDMLTRPEFYFARVEVPRLESDLDEFRAEQWITQRAIRASQLDARTLGAGAWPRTTSACLAYNRACEYLPICRGLAGDIEHSTPDGFVIVGDRHSELSANEDVTGAEL